MPQTDAAAPDRFAAAEAASKRRTRLRSTETDNRPPARAVFLSQPPRAVVRMAPRVSPHLKHNSFRRTGMSARKPASHAHDLSRRSFLTSAAGGAAIAAVA